MISISRSLSRRRYIGRRTFAADAAADGFKCVRDRGLDHAVEREKNLRPLLSIKDLISSEPAKSLPLSVITGRKEFLRVPVRPIEFVRSYPSVFMEFLPGGIGVHPHIKLTPEALDLDAEEQLVYTSESYKQELADRLLKLLMISKINKIPLEILHSLKWELGLPQDFVRSIVPEFPDYFRVINTKSSGADGELELVCWSNEHAVSVLEKKAKTEGKREYSKGMPIAFPLNFSKGVEMDKKVKKWVDEWQKLPYISPYENASHLAASSDESDKWAAAVLHEILNLFVSKKAERDSVLHLGEFLGLRSRFKRLLHHHPGIFYLSSKMRTYTVVLRDAYRRGMVIESSPLVAMRSRYIKLMNMVEEEHRGISSSKREDKAKVRGEVCDSTTKDESEFSGSEIEDEHEEDVVDDDSDYEEEVQNQTLKDGRRNSVGREGRRSFGHSENQTLKDGRRNSGGREDRRSFGHSENQTLKDGRRNSVGRDGRRSFGHSENQTLKDGRRNSVGREGRRSFKHSENQTLKDGRRNSVGKDGRRSFGHSENQTLKDSRRNSVGREGRRSFGHSEDQTLKGGHRNSVGREGRRSFGHSENQTLKDGRRNSVGREDRSSSGHSGSRERPRSRGDKVKLLSEKRTRI